MFEFTTNFIWRLIQQNAILVNTGYWKVGVTSPGIPGKPHTNDVYYNIGIMDVVSTFAMGALGFGSATLATSGITQAGINLTSVVT